MEVQKRRFIQCIICTLHLFEFVIDLERTFSIYLNQFQLVVFRNFAQEFGAALKRINISPLSLPQVSFLFKKDSPELQNSPFPFLSELRSHDETPQDVFLCSEWNMEAKMCPPATLNSH